jgi:tetratricopeptide (TPR) repeat protein
MRERTGFAWIRAALLAAVALAWLHAQEQDALAPTVASLTEGGHAAYLKGDYESARQQLLKAWDLAQQTTPDSDPVRYDVLKRLTSVRAAAGEFADADNFLLIAINWRELYVGKTDSKIADDLLIGVNLCRGMKDYDRGRAILQRVMGLHRLNNGPESAVLADDFSRMAQLYLDQKDLVSAIGSLNTALEIRRRTAGPVDPTLVPDLDRLAGAYVAQRAYGKAEETYRHALVIRETLLGREDPDLIATVDGLAYSCFGQKKFAEAEPIYQRLIGLWVKSVGDDHPMVAMALDKVASFYNAQNKFDQAREATERAIAIRALFLASGLSLHANDQITQGNKDAAIGMYRRALAAMEPPHPLFEKARFIAEDVIKTLESPAVKVPVRKDAPPRKK